MPESARGAKPGNLLEETHGHINSAMQAYSAEAHCNTFKEQFGSIRFAVCNSSRDLLDSPCDTYSIRNAKHKDYKWNTCRRQIQFLES